MKGDAAHLGQRPQVGRVQADSNKGHPEPAKLLPNFCLIMTRLKRQGGREREKREGGSYSCTPCWSSP